jgi:hypothetical protein
MYINMKTKTNIFINMISCSFNLHKESGMVFALHVIKQEEKTEEKVTFSLGMLIFFTFVLIGVYGLTYYCVFHSSAFGNLTISGTNLESSNILVSSKTFSIWGFSSDSELLNAFNMSSHEEFLLKYQHLLKNPQELNEIDITIEEFTNVVNNKMTPETIAWLLNVFNSFFI